MRRTLPILTVIAGILIWRWIALATPDSGDEWIGVLAYTTLGFSLVVDYCLLRQYRLGQFLTTLELGLRVTAAASGVAATLTFLPAPGYRATYLVMAATLCLAAAFVLDTIWRTTAIQKIELAQRSTIHVMLLIVILRSVQLLILGVVAAIVTVTTGVMVSLFNGGPTATVYQLIFLPPLLMVANYEFYRAIYSRLAEWMVAHLRLPRIAGPIGILGIVIVCAVMLRSPVAATAVLDVYPSRVERTIPADFLGLSFEAPTLTGSAFAVQNTTLLNLIKTLGSGMLRFGGNEVEFTGWSSNDSLNIETAYATLHPADLARMFAFARSTGWRVILGLNLGQNDPLHFSDEAETAFRLGGSSLVAVEIGNEPDLFMLNQQRTLLWNYQDYRTETEAYINAIRARVPDLPIAGPAVYGDSGWFQRSIQDMGLQLATYHFYPLTRLPMMLWGIPSAPTVDSLLSSATIRHAIELTDKLMQGAGSLPLQMDETNSVADSGKTGVSDVFAASLWSADHLFTLAEHGVHGVNFHTVWRCYTYTAICLRNDVYTAEPLYYGLLLFHIATQGQAQIVPLTLDTSANLSAHAVIGGDNKFRVVLINKEQSRPVSVNIKVDRVVSNAALMWLIAPSAYDHSHITLGGSQVATDGTWQPQQTESLSISANTLKVSMPPSSAVVITLK